MRGLDTGYSGAHNSGEIFCRVQAVSVPRICDAFASNVSDFQWVAIVDRLQLPSAILFVWNEPESLFNSIFDLNYIYTAGNHICLH